MVGPPRWTLVLQLTVRVISLGENDNALPWDMVLLEKLAEDYLRFASRVHIGGVECLSWSASKWRGQRTPDTKRSVATIRSRGKRGTYVDTDIIGVFELFYPFGMIWDHPWLP